MLTEIRELGAEIGLKMANLELDKCVSCDQPFTDSNVFTELGWKETKISGMCEVCFDGLFMKEDDEDE